MGTRADFYLGRGADAEWIGSIGWDGYPSGIVPAVLSATSQQEFTTALLFCIGSRDDFTAPEDGWPWPWQDSATTDYAYAFDDGRTWISRFGRDWYLLGDVAPSMKDPRTAVFPDMADRQKVALDGRSGVMFMQV